MLLAYSISGYCSIYHFYTPPHNSGGVLWFHVGHPCVCPSIYQSGILPSVLPSVHFSFPDDNLSKHQWMYLPETHPYFSFWTITSKLLFLLFLHFHSCSSFFPVHLFHLYYRFYLFSPCLWETTQNDPQGLTCRSTPARSI